MRRADQFVLIGSAVPLAWLVMMAVHEAGHVLGALLTGGTVKVVVLHPLKISCTVLYLAGNHDDPGQSGRQDTLRTFPGGHDWVGGVDTAVD